MDWSPQQEATLGQVGAWLKSPSQQVFRLFGFAGTGKTTLAKHLAQSVEGTTLFGAYTGKAALVLRQKGCIGATTIHRMIYKPREKSRMRLFALQEELTVAEQEHLGDGGAHDEPEPDDILRLRGEIKQEELSLRKPHFDLQFKEESDVSRAALVVIDECSMVGERIGADLLSFGVPVLVLGDPAQLPPVREGGYFTEASPDVLLTEVHRQALGSPVLALATRVREGGALEPGEWGESRVLRGTLPPEAALGCDQIIVGRNATRRAVNARMRELLVRQQHLPEPGDRLVCLRNNHDLGLLNGSIWTTAACQILGEDALALTVQEEASSPPIEVVAHRHHFEGREEQMSWFERREAEEFDYGYALTCHKAQGSQWASTLVIDESGAFRQDARRWLYTALTRAAERVTVVLS